MLGIPVQYYAKENIRRNGKFFKFGHRFTKEELQDFKQEELDRLLRIKAVSTDREEIEYMVKKRAEMDRSFKVTEEAMAKRNYRP